MIESDGGVLLSPAAALHASGVTSDANVYVYGMGAAISACEVGTALLHKLLCNFSQNPCTSTHNLNEYTGAGVNKK